MRKAYYVPLAVALLSIIIVLALLFDRRPSETIVITPKPKPTETIPPISEPTSEEPVPQPSPTTQETADTEIAEVTNAIQVRIVDALRDPVPNAWLRIGERTIQDINGKIEIPDEEITSDYLVAGATGFTDATYTIQPDQKDSQRQFKIELKYLCAFDVRVMQEKNKALTGSGVEVRVYEGINPTRPPKDNITVKYSDFPNTNSAQITRDEHRIWVAKTIIPRVADDPLIQEQLQNHNHKVGDVIDQIGNCVTEAEENEPCADWWNDDYYLSRLRIWDTLAAYSGNPSFRHRALGILSVLAEEY